MPLTKEEIQQLEIDRANAKARCHESWQMLKALDKIARPYWADHDRWKKRFEEADRALAMELKRTVTPLSKKEKRKVTNLTKKLTQEDLEALLKELEEEI